MRLPLLLFSYCLQFLAILCLALAFVPILFAITFSLIFIVGLSAWSNAYYSKKNIARHKLKSKVSFYARITRLNWRVLRLCALALVINLFLYTAMRLHITTCYVDSLDQELEPLRQTLRNQAQTPP